MIQVATSRRIRKQKAAGDHRVSRLDAPWQVETMRAPNLARTTELNNEGTKQQSRLAWFLRYLVVKNSAFADGGRNVSQKLALVLSDAFA
jgi:hypothetical protein